MAAPSDADDFHWSFLLHHDATKPLASADFGGLRDPLSNWHAGWERIDLAGNTEIDNKQQLIFEANGVHDVDFLAKHLPNYFGSVSLQRCALLFEDRGAPIAGNVLAAFINSHEQLKEYAISGAFINIDTESARQLSNAFKTLDRLHLKNCIVSPLQNHCELIEGIQQVPTVGLHGGNNMWSHQTKMLFSPTSKVAFLTFSGAAGRSFLALFQNEMIYLAKSNAALRELTVTSAAATSAFMPSKFVETFRGLTNLSLEVVDFEVGTGILDSLHKLPTLQKLALFVTNDETFPIPAQAGEGLRRAAKKLVFVKESKIHYLQLQHVATVRDGEFCITSLVSLQLATQVVINREGTGQKAGEVKNLLRVIIKHSGSYPGVIYHFIRNNVECFKRVPTERSVRRRLK